VPVRFEENPGSLFGEMTRRTQIRSDPRRKRFRATSLRDGDIDLTADPDDFFTIVPLRGLDVIRRLQVDLVKRILQQC
jgi:hypothetical protein